MVHFCEMKVVEFSRMGNGMDKSRANSNDFICILFWMCSWETFSFHCLFERIIVLSKHLGMHFSLQHSKLPAMQSNVSMEIVERNRAFISYLKSKTDFDFIQPYSHHITKLWSLKHLIRKILSIFCKSSVKT